MRIAASGAATGICFCFCAGALLGLTADERFCADRAPRNNCCAECRTCLVTPESLLVRDLGPHLLAPRLLAPSCPREPCPRPTQDPGPHVLAVASRRVGPLPTHSCCPVATFLHDVRVRRKSQTGWVSEAPQCAGAGSNRRSARGPPMTRATRVKCVVDTAYRPVRMLIHSSAA